MGGFRRGGWVVLGLAVWLAGCPGEEPEPEAEPGPLMAGVARVRMPVPLGIGTVGYGGFGTPSGGSPFAEIYPATERIHGHPDFKAVVLSRGEDYEIAFLRSDTVGVFQQIRRDVVLRYRERTGRDLDDILLMGATHTHSGPGRVIDAGGPFVLIADTFFPQHYDRMVEAMVDAVEGAYADLQPARLGTAVAQPVDAHNDRRCEDGLDYDNPDLPVLAVERAGQIDALVMSFAIHGTVLGIDDLTISQDVHGGIEQSVEDRFDHPVEVLLFNSWGADMSPGNPDVASRVGAVQPDGYEQMEKVGFAVADAVEAGLASATWSEEPVVEMQTHRVRIDREAIGYEAGVFEYDYGAVYCGSGREADCDPTTTYDDIDEMCIAFPEEFPAPNQTVISVGQVGEMSLVTFPGEPGTLLAEEIMDTVGARSDVERVMFFGYSQDYLGYSILEDDWWQGGYEAGGALWGPRQGEHLKDEAIRIFHGYRDGSPYGTWEPTPIATFDASGADPWVATTPIDVATVHTEVLASYAPTDTVEFVISGTDPWLGAPIAYLEKEDGTPVLRGNGVAVDSDDYSFWVELTTDPTYGEDGSAAQRAFYWHYHLPLTKSVAGWPELDGTYAIRVEIPQDGGEPLQITSAVFAVDAGN